MTNQGKRNLILRLNNRLIERARRYAAQSIASVSELGEAGFRQMVGPGEVNHTPLVRQLTGILPADVDLKELYGRYLLDKYTG